MKAEEMPLGVKMILSQGNLDHWFGVDLWGEFRPSAEAFDYAHQAGLIERKDVNVFRADPLYRLTDAGRRARAALEQG